MIIDGPVWFALGLLFFAFTVLVNWHWRLESRAALKLWDAYDKASEERHQEFLAALREAREP